MLERGFDSHRVKNSVSIRQLVTDRDHVGMRVLNKFVKDDVRKVLGFPRVPRAQVEDQTIGQVFDERRVLCRVWVGGICYEQMGKDHFSGARENRRVSSLSKVSFASAALKGRLGLSQRPQTYWTSEDIRIPPIRGPARHHPVKSFDPGLKAI